MFESERVAATGPAELLEEAAALERHKSCCDALRFTALADFAEHHTSVDELSVPGGPRLVEVGGDGTPAIDEFCLSEFAATAGLQEGTARAQLATALDLRHRLPRVLKALHDGRIPAWRARLVAETTRALTLHQVRLAEDRILPFLDGVGSRRLEEIVRQVVIDTDPDAAEQETDEAKDRRHVSLDPEDDHGLVTGGFCADPADALRFGAPSTASPAGSASLATPTPNTCAAPRPWAIWLTRRPRWV